MDHLESIDIGLKSKKPYNEIVRKVFLTYPTKVLMGDEERQYEIVNEISTFFEIPINNIQVAGSAKTGKSFFKNQDFIPMGSDLDIAIIDSSLFKKYMEDIFKITKGHTDHSGFQIRNGVSTANEYLQYLSKGIFRSDLMPTSNIRAEWSRFFGTLSKKHGDLFRTINARVYLSQVFFENKQRSAIKHYIENKAV